MLYALEGPVQKSQFLMLLTTLALGNAVTSPQGKALDEWADVHLPVISQALDDLLKPPFAYGEMGALAEVAVTAAQELKGIFKGMERAKIAQAILVVAAHEIAPDGFQNFLLPLLQGAGAEALIEAAFQRLFGDASPKSVPPVVDAPEVAEGGIQ